MEEVSTAGCLFLPSKRSPGEEEASLRGRRTRESGGCVSQGPGRTAARKGDCGEMLVSVGWTWGHIYRDVNFLK